MLVLSRGPETVALTSLCRAVDDAGDYWIVRGGLPGLDVLDTLFMDAVREHYGETPEQMETDGFGTDEHFDRLVGAMLAIRLHLPHFPITRYKGGGFSCSSLP